jgi:D-glycero-alpha-D-manno-heptose 1-phosphate guanylyltransferase
MEAIILAGGFGTRLQSRLDGIPKPMVLVAGRPFLEILVNRLIDSGFRRIILSVGHLASVISDHFGSAWRDVPVEYVVEDEPLGTGGAIRKSMERISALSTFVLNGDTWLDVDYAAMNELHQRSHAGITLALSRVPDTTRFGGVILESQRVVRFIEKGQVSIDQSGPGSTISGSTIPGPAFSGPAFPGPASSGPSFPGPSFPGPSFPGWINGGVYILASDFPWPADLPAKFSFETAVLHPWLPMLSHAVYFSSGRFIDIGVPEDLDRAQTELSKL